jgi:hypothetical protein
MRGMKIENLINRIIFKFFVISHQRELTDIESLRNQFPGIQLMAVELLYIVKAIRQFPSCRMLVFGLGNDSHFWVQATNPGQPVFLEDRARWFNEITTKYPSIHAYHIDYPCKITEWKGLLDKPDQLQIILPKTIKEGAWDVVLVDGPRGYDMLDERLPGRMSSIYMASRLVKEGGYVFVHDAEREVERVYADRFLGVKNFKGKIRGRALLKKYHFCKV